MTKNSSTTISLLSEPLHSMPLSSKVSAQSTGFALIPARSTGFARTYKTVPTRQSIALISVHGDPAAEIGQEGAGGQNVYVRQVGEALAQLGWQVDMFTRKASPDAPDIEHHSAHCRTIRLKAGPEVYIPRDRLYEHLPEFVQAFKAVYATGNYPLIHTNYWLSGWVGLQLRQDINLQWVHTYHSLGAVKYQTATALPEIAQTRLAIERQILETADRVIATSPCEQDDLRSLVSPQGAIEVIPCGTDIQNFQRIEPVVARAQLGIQPSDRVVLYVGRFDQRKGIETLVRAVANLAPDPNLRLVIVGGSDPTQADGAERRRIEQLVQDLGISDQTWLVGRIGHDQLPLYYSAADICVVPSHYEPFGLVAIEAMACGTPVIASDVGGLRFTVVPGQTGLLVPPQDSQALAGAIEQLLSQPTWATFLGNNAAHWVQTQFSWTGIATQLGDLYRYLLAASLMQQPTPLIRQQVSKPLATVSPIQPVRQRKPALAS